MLEPALAEHAIAVTVYWPLVAGEPAGGRATPVLPVVYVWPAMQAPLAAQAGIEPSSV
jgi:hypothetical protein